MRAVINKILSDVKGGVILCKMVLEILAISDRHITKENHLALFYSHDKTNFDRCPLVRSLVIDSNTDLVISNVLVRNE